MIPTPPFDFDPSWGDLDATSPDSTAEIDAAISEAASVGFDQSPHSEFFDTPPTDPEIEIRDAIDSASQEIPTESFDPGMDSIVVDDPFQTETHTVDPLDADAPTDHAPPCKTSEADSFSPTEEHPEEGPSLLEAFNHFFIVHHDGPGDPVQVSLAGEAGMQLTAVQWDELAMQVEYFNQNGMVRQALETALQDAVDELNRALSERESLGDSNYDEPHASHAARLNARISRLHTEIDTGHETLVLIDDYERGTHP